MICAEKRFTNVRCLVVALILVTLSLQVKGLSGNKLDKHPSPPPEWPVTSTSENSREPQKTYLPEDAAPSTESSVLNTATTAPQHTHSTHRSLVKPFAMRRHTPSFPPFQTPSTAALGLSLWSSPSSWPSGKIPVDGDAVVLTGDMSLLLDVSTPSLISLTIAGTLTVARRNVNMTAGGCASLVKT